MTPKSKEVIEFEGFKLYSATKVMEILGVCHTTIYGLLNEGKLKGRKIGRTWFVSEENLKSFLGGTDKPEPGERGSKDA